MVTVEAKTVPIGKVKLNPDNPRTIKQKDLDLLVKSIQDFPDMLRLREVVVDESMTVLGGNMRVLALRKAGVPEVQIKLVSGLPDEQKREFVIKDNGSYGEWDFDALANSWSDLPLAEWGINLPVDWLAPIPDGNKEIDEDEMSKTENECPKCGFKW